MKSNFAPPTPFGSISCVIVGVCLSNYNLNLFLIHQASYSKENQRYLVHREVLGSIWKIVSEVLHSLSGMCQYAISSNLLNQSFDLSSVIKFSLVTVQQMRSLLSTVRSLMQSTVWSESCVGICYSCLASKSGSVNNGLLTGRWWPDTVCLLDSNGHQTVRVYSDSLIGVLMF